MAVIWREDRIIGGKQFAGVKVYKSDRFVTREAEGHAEQLDTALHDKLTAIEKDIRKLRLLDLKGKGGVLKLWYEVGQRLKFVDSLEVSPPEDKRYIWRALYDHAGDLAPGTPKVRANERWQNSHFFYCYRIGQFPWNFVEGAGNWTAWVEFFDSPRISQDSRIVEWLGSKTKVATGSKQDWLRKLTKEVRRAFQTTDTTVFSKDELYERLDAIFQKTYG